MQPNYDATGPQRSSKTSPDDDKMLKQRMLQHLSWLVIASVLLAIGLAWLISQSFRDASHEAWIVLSSGDQAQIRDYIRSFGAWAPAASVVLMVSQVVLAPIPASVVQLSNGVVFGILGGTILNLIGQMAGASIAFFISRSLGRSAAERLAGKVDEHGIIEHWLDVWGAKALLVIRMIPGMPSDFVSYLMGLTSMPARRYLIVSAIGYLPQSLAYAWLGDYATDWFWWIVLGGFGVSGIIAIVLAILRKLRPTPHRAALRAQPRTDS